jgi:hypothetical protein
MPDLSALFELFNVTDLITNFLQNITGRPFPLKNEKTRAKIRYTWPSLGFFEKFTQSLLIMAPIIPSRILDWPLHDNAVVKLIKLELYFQKN